MSIYKPNASAATLTKNRTEGSINPYSGMCVTCIDGCVGMCEIGKSAYRGHETLYPQPFGIITTASEKKYPVDYSHFSIMGTMMGAKGIEADTEKAIFPNVELGRSIGKNKDIRVKLPVVISGIGSTDVARNNWESLAAGAALCGIILTVGENVSGMDEDAVLENGRVVKTSDLKRRVELFKKWQVGGCGAIVVQANVEDSRLGTLEYALEQLDVDAVELKWGQGAKDIGGEVKIKSLDKALMLKKRGYVVLPDPEDPHVAEAFRRGSFKEFERHSLLGIVDEESFLQRVKSLREAGARNVFLKTGAYRPADLARALRFSSLADIDLVTVDGAGGGTGMSPWRMMNEWGVPSVELHSLLYSYCEKLKAKDHYMPDISLGGGFAFEDQIFKGLAIAAPHVKLIGMARAPLAAAMVGKTIGSRIAENKLPVYVERFGSDVEEIFVTASELKHELGSDLFEELPPGALGLYTYYERLAQGLKQLMCGNRKFSLEYISRDDIAALTKEAAEISGIKHVMDLDREEAEQILDF